MIKDITLLKVQKNPAMEAESNPQIPNNQIHN